MNQVIEFAHEHEYLGATYRFDWNGWKIYEPTIRKDDGTVPSIGIPTFIMEKGDTIRLSDYNEGFEILDSLIRGEG